MHQCNKKWSVIYVLTNGKHLEVVFNSEGSAQDHIKNSFAGKNILRNEYGESYTTYPPSSIVEARVKSYEEDEEGQICYNGPRWNV